MNETHAHFQQHPFHSTACAYSWKVVFPLAQLAYVNWNRASGLKGEDMGEACMDTACQGVVLASKRQDVASKRVMACVHVVDVDGLRCHARRGHPPWYGQDEAMHLKEDKRNEKVGHGKRWALRPPYTAGICGAL